MRTKSSEKIFLPAKARSLFHLLAVCLMLCTTQVCGETKSVTVSFGSHAYQTFKTTQAGENHVLNINKATVAPNIARSQITAQDEQDQVIWKPAGITAAASTHTYTMSGAALDEPLWVEIEGEFVKSGAGGVAGAPKLDFVVSVLKVESVELVSGATANNVIPPHTWAAVKNTDYVVVKAVLNPDVNETAIPDGFVTWTGGESVSGHPLQRRVSKQTAAHTPVIASCGGSSATGDVWIVWANLEIKTSGTTPPNAAQFGGDYDATENLGAQSYTRNGYNWAAGKVIPTGSLTPSGVHNVISNGWDIKREFWRHDFKDGAVWSGRWETSWANDSFTPEDKKRFHPDSDDQIYDFDGPDIGNFTGVTDSCERYDNFCQWVEWNSIQCSDYSGWYWKGRWKIDQSPNVTLKEVGSGAINPLPDENGHYYNPP